MNSPEREELENILRDAALTRIRFYFVIGLWFVMCWVPQWKAIFNSMNVELPMNTKVMLALSDILQDWWFVLVPTAWIGWRVYEDRALKHFSYRTVDWFARVLLMLGLICAHAFWSPFCKLINNVG